MVRPKGFLYYERLLLESYREGAREALGPEATEAEVETLARQYYEGPQRDGEGRQGGFGSAARRS